MVNIDTRSRLLVGLTPENLAVLAATWRQTTATPGEVSALLAQARRLFVGAAHTYDSFVSAALTALQASERALSLRLGGTAPARATLGVLVHVHGLEEILDEYWLRWYREFALHFRNRLAHPADALAFAPGMSEPIVRTSHEAVAALFPD